MQLSHNVLKDQRGTVGKIYLLFAYKVIRKSRSPINEKREKIRSCPIKNRHGREIYLKWNSSLFFPHQTSGGPTSTVILFFNFYLISPGRLPQIAACRYARPIYFQQAYDKIYFFVCKIFVKKKIFLHQMLDSSLLVMWLFNTGYTTNSKQYFLVPM